MSSGVSLIDAPLSHIGVAIGDIEEGLRLYGLVGWQLDHREVLKDQQVEVAFIGAKPPYIELLAPVSNQGPIAKFLERRGPGLHHLCFEVKDIKSELERLEQLNVHLIDREPRPGARGHLVAFLHPKSFGGTLIELCQP
ncbi:MAG: methylmalonyl-CoA epimerase [Proteobacteria bacterium]|nr:MAG: methylmalonyl-CoA epimerase [Pseudomonadota bacterium]